MPDPNANKTIFLPLVMRDSSGGAEDTRRRTPTPSPTPTRTPTATPQAGGAPAIYIDLNRCIGCNACSLACKQENRVELEPGVWSEVGEWNEVYGSESGAFPTAGIRVLPMLCHHCGDAPCKAKCDSLGIHAIVQRSDGIVYIDPARCTGCQQCLPTCRYKAISFNATTKKAEKCHFCMHRIDAGLEPACVITCLAITREFGDYNALRAKYPNAKAMGDKVRILYGNLGGEPDHDGSTAGYPNPVECHH